MTKLSIDTKIIHEIVKQIVQDKETTITFSLPAMQGSSEYLFNCIDKELFYLPLRGVKPMNGYNDWLFQPLEHRSIGAVEQPYIYDTYRLTDGFDAVVFIKTSTVHNR